MDTLQKHKKNGEKGFQKFVRSLEAMNEEARQRVIQVVILEDPVYLAAAMSNIVNFDYLFRLDSEEKRAVFDGVVGGVKTLLFALKNYDGEEEFVSDLGTLIASRYKDEAEYFKVPEPSLTLKAQGAFVESMRKLQVALRISDFKWKLPSDSTLHGSAFRAAAASGEFLYRYDNGRVALEGELEKKLRVGPWKHYYPNGGLMASGIYISSEKQGAWEFFYSDGKIKAQGEYRENLKEGNWYVYDKDGVVTQVIYKRGKIHT